MLATVSMRCWNMFAGVGILCQQRRRRGRGRGGHVEAYGYELDNSGFDGVRFVELELYLVAGIAMYHRPWVRTPPLPPRPRPVCTGARLDDRWSRCW